MTTRGGIEFIVPDWPAPTTVRAASTTRLGGVSAAPFDTLNLGDHVGDRPEAVAENRRRVAQALQLPAAPFWLSQCHGTEVVQVGAGPAPEADGALALAPGRVCAVLTADCLPVLLCDRAGTRVAALHAGWRGLCAGILERGVAALGIPARELMAWLGPAIGARAFEVGAEVRAAFVAADAEAAQAFTPSPQGRWLADLSMLARQRLIGAGVGAVHGGGVCTFSDSRRFYSYRRDGRTGRMASLIWLQ